MPSAKILVVDDDPDFVQVTRIVLESADYQVVSASDSVSALEQIRVERPDLMLLDVMMATATDGLDLSERLRQDQTLRYLPIVMITSVADTSYSGEVSTSDSIRMEAWLSKPVDPKHLLETVQHILASDLT